MANLLLLLALFTLLIWVSGGVQVAVGALKIDYLRNARVSAEAAATSVSIVVAARNEEAHLGEAVRSLLQQRGTGVEVVVVNDRSTDRTAGILERARAEAPELHVVHVGSLPDGWLGKTHALQRGAEAASGEWLLFTDADVVLGEDAAARGVSYSLEHGLDHLAATPELTMPTLGSDLFAGAFILLFSRYSTPWKARDAKSPSYIGIGAYNLVRAECYRRVGGHREVSLRPDDDMMLGKILKRGGCRQDVVYGTGEVKVEWYPGLGAAVRGLEKNAFAGMGYSVTRVAAMTFALFLFVVLPWFAAPLTGGLTQIAFAGSILVMAVLYLGSARSAGSRWWLVPGLPFAMLGIIYAVWRSTILAVKNDGIRWRDTFYDLQSLRDQRP